jgi:hypothetical protein
MKFSLRKVNAEKQIKRIEKELAALAEQEAQASLTPIERTDETFMVITHADEKKRLEAELQKYRKVLEEESK